MSFIYCSNVWVINLDRKGYWITESEQKIVHCPIHYVRWGQCGFKTFRPSVREKSFCRILFYFKRKKYVCVNFVLLFVLLFTIIQSILAVARYPQWCLPYAFSALPSWILFPPFLFKFQGIRLKADFIATMSFTHSFFQFTRDKFPAKFSNDNLLMTRDPRKLVTPFPVKLELKIKNKGK